MNMPRCGCEQGGDCTKISTCAYDNMKDELEQIITELEQEAEWATKRVVELEGEVLKCEADWQEERKTIHKLQLALQQANEAALEFRYRMREAEEQRDYAQNVADRRLDYLRTHVWKDEHRE